MGGLEKLGRLEPRIAMLAVLALEGVKPASKVDGFEGPDEVVAEILRGEGLEVELRKSGCRTDILFGTPGGLEAYGKAAGKKGEEKIVEKGLAFGYPECCARHFARFMAGEEVGKPRKEPPLEHFVCPDCTQSGQLKEKYEKALKKVTPA